MHEQNPAELVTQARKHLMNIVVTLKEGNVEQALKSVIFGLFIFIKHGNLLIRQEKKEFQDLLTKSVHILSLDTTIKELCKEPLEYVQKKELELLARLRALPEQIQAVRQKRVEQHAEARLQSRIDRLEKGRALLQQKYFDGAIQHFKRLCDDFPGDHDLFAEIGKMLFNINHIESITFLEMAVASDPADHQSYAMMGVAFRKIKKFEQAEQAYLSALEAAPENVNYLFNLSRVYIDSGNWAKAQETLHRVLILEPGLEPAKKGLEFASRHCRDLL